jgi:cell cycle sensor histidine kinase DivJ
VSFFTPVRSYVDALAHPAAQQDALTLARHRAFIAPRLLGSLGAIASPPVYIVGRGGPTTLEVGMSVTALVIPVAACTGSIRGIAMSANIQVKKSA